MIKEYTKCSRLNKMHSPDSNTNTVPPTCVHIGTHRPAHREECDAKSSVHEHRWWCCWWIQYLRSWDMSTRAYCVCPSDRGRGTVTSRIPNSLGAVCEPSRYLILFEYHDSIPLLQPILAFSQLTYKVCMLYTIKMYICNIWWGDIFIDCSQFLQRRRNQ